MKSPKAPAAPSFDQLNKANTQSAFQQASFNRPNQSDQFGNTLNYAQTGTDAQGNPTFSANQSLGATGQQYASGLTGLGQSYFDKVNAGADLGSMDAFNKAQGFYDEANAPYEAQQRNSLENKLRNQGFDPSSEAFKNATMASEDQIGRNRNAFTQSAQGQFFGQGLQGRQQELGELQPGVEFGNMALNPSYAQVPGVNVGNQADIMQSAYGNQYNQYKDKQAQQNAMLGGLAGLGGTILVGPIGGAIGSSMFGGGGSSGGYGNSWTPMVTQYR